MRKRWVTAAPTPQSQVERFPALSPLMVQVLYNRGLVSPVQVDGFLSGALSEGDPFELPDMARATDSLIRAIRNQVPMAVYGDFDADGVTATALLVQALASLGADVRAYIPNRVDEGYGINLNALRDLYRDGVRLVVTVDCGIRAVDEIDQARRGIEFIVTDHHSVGPQLPKATAVINPKCEDSRYAFRDLAGVGVAYKLAQALLREAQTCGLVSSVSEHSLLDLVALGSVADLVPLVGENRVLVREGLRVLNGSEREGLQALLEQARVRSDQVGAETISYVLGPRLNAAGRLGDADLSYKLLLTMDRPEARELARQLDQKNRERQALTSRAYDLAEKLALARGADAPLLYAGHPSFPSGIVGLVAGKLTESYYRPAVVVEQGAQECRASCRSIKEFHITRALDECRDLLVRHGGHKLAAGFTVHRENLDRLMERLLAIAAQELSGKELMPTLGVDACVPVEDLGWETASWLKEIEPCGQGNPAPVFASHQVPVLDQRTVGAQSQHLKLKVDAGGEAREAIGFHLADCGVRVGDRVDLAYNLQVNDWNGHSSLQLNVLDINLNRS